VDRVKSYLLRHFEQVFILFLSGIIIAVTYLIPQRVPFLTLYFLPVIMAGYFLGLRGSIPAAIACILLVLFSALRYPELLLLPGTLQHLYLYLLTWGFFLIFTGAMVGWQREQLKLGFHERQQLSGELEQSRQELADAHASLNEYRTSMERKVEQRTRELARARDAAEASRDKIEKILYTTMDPAVVRLISEGRLRNEKRRISIMFSDIVGFTRYSEKRSPESIVQDLNRYLKAVEPILSDYHGHTDKYAGDGIMCEFGAPLDYANYRLLAVLAAMKMQQSIDRLDYPWQTRIGIASGPVVMGLIGSRRQYYTAIGDVVNLAARLEKSCPPGSILVDSATVEGVAAFVDLRLKRSLVSTQRQDSLVERELAQCQHALDRETEPRLRAELYEKMGQLYMSVGEADEAAHSFERVLELFPDNDNVKVAFAEATMQKQKAAELSVRGREQKVAAYEVVGLKDVLLDREKIPLSLYHKYGSAEELIRFSDDIILPVEALDGSIGHARVVAILSYAIASELGVAEQEKLDILHAGYVADIGKKNLPPHLLNRMGALSANELQEVEKHPLEGPRILKEMGYDSELMLDIVLHSHESFDGSGYPHGLKGEEIPLGARIILVADVYDALTSWRPYREKWDRQAACEEIRRGAEKGLFDPQVVESFLKLMHS